MRKIVLFLSGITLCTSAMAGNNSAKAYWTAWGGGTFKSCLGDSISGSNACIGASADNACKPVTSTDPHQAILMMVAHTITNDYAIFCPTQLDTGYNSNGTTWTLYRNPVGGNISNCVKLYRTYTNKAADDNAASCDSETVFRDNFSGASMTTSASGNIEPNIPGFYTADGTYDCGNSKGYLDHDIILAIIDWTPGGHGAFVQPIQFRGARESWYESSPKSWPMLSPVNGSQRVLACKLGYRANDNKTNCEPFDVTKCAMNDNDKLANLCTTQSKSNYDKAQHKFEYDEQNTCYELRCRQDGYAFTDTDTLTCDPCISSGRQGINPKNGKCVECSIGEVFSTKAVSTGYCAKARAFSRDDLRYGPQKSSSAPLNKQCWTLQGDEYTNCVTGGN